MKSLMVEQKDISGILKSSWHWLLYSHAYHNTRLLQLSIVIHNIYGNFFHAKKIAKRDSLTRVPVPIPNK
jgi:hypothetical protein